MIKAVNLVLVLLLSLFVNSCEAGGERLGSVERYRPQEGVPNEQQLELKDEKKDRNDVALEVMCGNRTIILRVERSTVGKRIKVSERDVVTKTISLPDQNDLNGFSLNWLKPTERGLSLSVEYGSRFYFQRNFEFVCENNNLVLGGIEVAKFDKHNPEDTWEEFSERIDQKVPLDAFELRKYLTLQ